MKEVILRCDLYFHVTGLDQDADLGTLKANLARDLVSQVRNRNSGDKEWSPGGKLKTYLRASSENVPVFELLFEEEAASALK
jgi:hypothetical protein